MNLNLFKKDYSYGIKSEEELKELFTRKFGEVKKAYSKTSTYDYYGLNVFLELKTRRNEKDKYPTTMIGKNKFDWADTVVKVKPETKIYFIFCFTDGVYYWEYLNEKIPEIKFDIGGRWDRGCNEISVYAYIPTSQLIKLE